MEVKVMKELKDLVTNYIESKKKDSVQRNPKMLKRCQNSFAI